MKHIEIYSDGSSLGNPGPGGYGVILRYPEKDYEKEFSEGFNLTTNNRMELRGVITGLSKLKEPCDVLIITDSQYVIKGFTEWLPGWIKKGWKTSSKSPVENRDLWQELLTQANRHEITWHWIKGHNGHAYNERCDELARKAASSTPTKKDPGYNH